MRSRTRAGPSQRAVVTPSFIVGIIAITPPTSGGTALRTYRQVVLPQCLTLALRGDGWYKHSQETGHLGRERGVRGGENMKAKFIGAVTVALLLLLVFAVAAQAVPQSTIDKIIKDAADGTIDGNCTAAEIHAALAYVENNPTFDQYSEIKGSLEDYLASLAGSRRAGRPARLHRRRDPPHPRGWRRPHRRRSSAASSSRVVAACRSRSLTRRLPAGKAPRRH